MKKPPPADASEGNRSEGAGTEVGAAELHVSGVLMDGPVLGSALLAGGAIEVRGGGVNGAEEGEAEGEPGGDGEVGVAHRSQAARNALLLRDARRPLITGVQQSAAPVPQW